MNYPTNFPELSSERLNLRQVSFKDKRAIFKLRSNKEINQLISRETPKNLNESGIFIQTCLDEFEKGNRIFWVLELKESNQVIGSIVFHKINSEKAYAEIGYELNPDFQKEGFMTEAMKSVIEFASDSMKIKTVEAYTHKNNNPSIALLEKHQFLLDRTKKDDFVEDNSIFRLDIN